MSVFRNVLVPLDFSFNALQGLRYASALTARFGGSITLAHVVQPVFLPPPLSSPVASVDELIAAAEQQLGEIAARESGAGAVVRTLVRSGETGSELAGAAAATGADLIVMSTHGHTGLAHLLMGSAAEKVVRSARCPVLTVRPSEAGGVPSVALRRILLATDFSARARAAFPLARQLAEASEAELVLVHVLEAPVTPAATDLPAGRAVVDGEIEAAAQQRLESLRRDELGGANARLVLRSGRAHVQLVDLATTEKVDLIVLATHGRTGLDHLLIGSTAERVVRHAPCPVLTVREAETD